VMASWLISTALSDDRSLILAAVPLVPPQYRDSPFSMFDVTWIMSFISRHCKASLIRYIKLFSLWTFYLFVYLFVFYGALYDLAEGWKTVVGFWAGTATLNVSTNFKLDSLLIKFLDTLELFLKVGKTEIQLFITW
jgi:hypothetical protein